MLVRQRAIVALGGRLLGRQAGNVSQADSKSPHVADWKDDMLAVLVRQRTIVTSGVRLLGRQAGNVSQVESNRHLGWQTGRKTCWLC